MEMEAQHHRDAGATCKDAHTFKAGVYCVAYDANATHQKMHVSHNDTSENWTFLS